MSIHATTFLYSNDAAVYLFNDKDEAIDSVRENYQAQLILEDEATRNDIAADGTAAEIHTNTDYALMNVIDEVNQNALKGKKARYSVVLLAGDQSRVDLFSCEKEAIHFFDEAYAALLYVDKPYIVSVELNDELHHAKFSEKRIGVSQEVHLFFSLIYG